MKVNMQMKIGGKLAVSAGFSILLVLGLVLNQWHSNARINEAVSATQREQTILDGIKGAELALSQMRRLISEIGQARTKEAIVATMGAVEAAERTGRAGLDAPIRIALRPAVLQQIQTSLADFRDAARDIARQAEASSVGSNPVVSIAAITDVRIAPIVNQAMRAIEESVSNATRFTAEANAETAAAVSRGLVVAIALGAAVMLVLLGSAVFSMLHIARPLRRIGDVLRDLATGNKAVEIPYSGRGDEVGANARAAQAFKENLLRMDLLEAETRQARLDAEAGRKRQMAELADRFETAMGGIVGMVSSAATLLQKNAQSMSGSAGETSSQAGAVSAAALQASANVQTVSAAAEQLSASVAEITRQVSQSSTVASRAAEDARRTDKTVRALSDSAQRIGEVVSMISNIAGQTNLLALNATIEAARAGDAGKGFAVVASEVKALASQTAQATGEIGQQINAIQSATRDAVADIQAIAATIDEVNAIAGAIALAVEEQGAATQEIARNVQQAATGTQVVTHNIGNVSRAAGETGTAAGEVLSAAAELSRQAGLLGSEVDAFLAGVKAA